MQQISSIRNVFASWIAPFLLWVNTETCSRGHSHNNLPTLFNCASVSDILCQHFYWQGNSFLTFISITANTQIAERWIFLPFKSAHLLCQGSESAWRILGLHGWLLLFCNPWWAPPLPLTTGMWLHMLTVNLAFQKWEICTKSFQKVLRSSHIIDNGGWAFCSSWCGGLDKMITNSPFHPFLFHVNHLDFSWAHYYNAGKAVTPGSVSEMLSHQFWHIFYHSVIKGL